MPQLTGIALAPNQDGRLELVAVSGGGGSPAVSGPGGSPEPAGAVWHAWQKSPNGDWSGWASLGQPGSGISGNAPAVARNSGGCLEAVVIADDGTVWHRAQTAPNGPGWSDWQSLERPGGKEAAGTPALAQDKDGSLEVFVVRQSDTTVWHASDHHETGWSGWDSLDKPGGGVSLEPNGIAVASNSDGRLELFVTDSQAIWHRWQRQQGGWSHWSPLGTPEPPGGQIRVPVVARPGGGRLHLFTAASDGVVWLRSQHDTQPDGWIIWQVMGRSWFDEVGVGVDGGGRLTLVTTSRERRLWQRGQLSPEGFFPAAWRLDWSSFGTSSYENPGLLTHPTLAPNADGRLELFLLHPGAGDLYQFSQAPPKDVWPPAVWSDAREWPLPQ
jgi:hypothetical protein